MQLKSSLTLLFALAPLCSAQLEIGPIAGFGYPTGMTAQNGSASADVGFKPGPSVGLLYSEYFNERLSGETRYLFQFGDLKVSQGGTEVTFPGRSHLIHYDFLYHARSRESSVRPFVAVGAGVRWVEGTGTQQSYQPLSDLALLSHSREILPLISAGGGIKLALTRSFLIRVEMRDYMNPHSFSKAIAAAPGARLHGWVHELTPLVALTYTR